MPRKPTISPSKLTTYLACPVKYRWTYADVHGRARWLLRARAEFSFGCSLHKALERLHDSGDTGVQTTAQALAALEENWIDAGYQSAQQMQEALGEGHYLLERALAEELTAPPPNGRTLMVERSLRKDMGDFDLVGRPDRVDELPDGSLEIVDYKSGRRQCTAEDVAHECALGCYALLLRELYPGRPIYASIIALREGVRATHAYSSAELDELEEAVRTTGIELLNRELEMVVPRAKPLCANCDFLRLCARHEDFDQSALTAQKEPGQSLPG